MWPSIAADSWMACALVGVLVRARARRRPCSSRPPATVCTIHVLALQRDAGMPTRRTDLSVTLVLLSQTESPRRTLVTGSWSRFTSRPGAIMENEGSGGDRAGRFAAYLADLASVL